MMARKRHRFSPFESLGSLESLGLRISPSALALGAIAEVSTISCHDLSPADSGDDPPITQPTLPSTGPGGPGSSS
jgi:hypothetical protein